MKKEPNDPTVHDLIFEEVKADLHDELDDEMRKWSYDRLLEELQAAVNRHNRHENIKKSEQVRSFSRRFLFLSGDRHQPVGACLRGEETMDRPTLRRVFLALKGLRQPTFDAKAVLAKINQVNTEEILPRPRRREPKQAIEEPNDEGPRRKLVDHTISMLGSLADLVAVNNIERNDAFDGDRIELVKSIKTICDHFGINITVPNIDDNSCPVTQEDLQELYKINE